MIELTVRPARTSFSGPERKLAKMFRSLRVRDEKGAWWRAKAYLSKSVEDFYSIPYQEQKEMIERESQKAKFQFIRFYDRRSDTFETGLIFKVEKYLNRKGINYKVIDKRNIPSHFKPIDKLKFKDSVEDRPEQVNIVNEALTKGRGIIHAATNTGKTECACAIISEYSRQSSGRVPRVLFLVHRSGLAEQTAERFKKHLADGIRIEVVGGGKKHIPRKSGIVVATVQTASNLLDDPDFERFQEKCDILFIDELHVNKAWQCSRIVVHNSAPMRFSLSGTVDKKNKIKMMHYIGMTGPIIAEVKNKELVSLGRSAKPVIRFVEVSASEIPKRSKFAAAYNLGIVKSKERNNLVVKETLRYLKKDYKTLVTVSRISHGLMLKSLLEKKIDLRVEFLSGSTPMEVRKNVIRQFEKGKVGVLIASPIFDTGVDVPSIEAWVAAGGGLGWELVLQRLGRVLRKKKGDNRVFISDFIDMHNHYLMKHSMARLSHYHKEKIADISIVEARK